MIKSQRKSSATLWFNQDMLRLPPRPHLLVILFTFACAQTVVQACAPQMTPTPFRPPTQPGPTLVLPTTTSVPQLFTAVPTVTVTATIEGPCTNNLSFIDDITIDDGTSVSPGSTIDKQWLVQNSGSCNWDATYRLRWIGGDPLGANTEQLLYPARAGTQATLRIEFTAPQTEGPYESAWQAVGPDGNVFGDLVFIKIVVAP
jgi:hypothetical protein